MTEGGGPLIIPQSRVGIALVVRAAVQALSRDVHAPGA